MADKKITPTNPDKVSDEVEDQDKDAERKTAKVGSRRPARPRVGASPDSLSVREIGVRRLGRAAYSGGGSPPLRRLRDLQWPT